MSTYLLSHPWVVRTVLWFTLLWPLIIISLFPTDLIDSLSYYGTRCFYSISGSSPLNSPFIIGYYPEKIKSLVCYYPTDYTTSTCAHCRPHSGPETTRPPTSSYFTWWPARPHEPLPRCGEIQLSTSSGGDVRGPSWPPSDVRRSRWARSCNA